MAHPLPEPAMPELATDAVLRPARTGNAFEDALERLLQAVKLGVFRQGDRLPPRRDLAAPPRSARGSWPAAPSR